MFAAGCGLDERGMDKVRARRASRRRGIILEFPVKGL
jgi:hypothetical protein